MGIFASNLAPASTDRALGGSIIERCLRFNGQNESTAPQLRRTGTTTSSSFSIAMWAKLSRVSDQYKMFFSIGQENDANAAWVAVQDGQNMGFQGGNGTYTTISSVFRDPTSWFHFLISVNSNNFTVYIDGTSVQTGTMRSLDTSTNGIRIGANYGSYYPWNGYLADVYLIDGQAKAPTDFGYTESQTGIWRPKKYTGTFGTGGAHLEFKDFSSVAALGKDTSGNGNDFTPTTDGFNVSAGTGNDSFPYSPSNTFPTFHNLFSLNQQGGVVTYSEGDLKIQTSASFSDYRRYPFAMSSPYFAVNSGKWYVEFLNASSACAFGVTNIGQLDYTVSNNPYGASASTSFIYTNTGEIRRDDSNLTSQASYGDGDVIGVALDLDNMKLYFHKNGTYINSANPNTGTNGYDLNSLPTAPINTGGFIFQAGSNGVSNITAHVNFGQRAFSHSIPTGFKILNLQNLPKPNAPIIRPQRHFDTVLYTGNAGTQKITGLEFKPDMIWFKSRTSTSTNGIADSVRGRSKLFYPDTNQAEETSSTTRDLVSFDDGGFTLGNPERLSSTNGSGLSIVAWCWKAGGAAVTNNDGSVTTTVSANPEAGFSIVDYNGGGNGSTMGHGLGKVPAWILVKKRDSDSPGNARGWAVYHQSLAADKALRLNSTGSELSEANFFREDLMSTTVFGVNSDYDTGYSGDDYMAYVWAEIPGYSKFGVYYGDNNSDGPYVYLGFRPAWVMIKNPDASSQEWYILDSKRDTDNPVGQYLSASSSAAEATYVFYDFLSDGFKLRNTGNAQNPDGQRIVYMAFAEQTGVTPFDTHPNIH
jgi:hypothetical protein